MLFLSILLILLGLGVTLAGYLVAVRRKYALIEWLSKGRNSNYILNVGNLMMVAGVVGVLLGILALLIGNLGFAVVAFLLFLLGAPLAVLVHRIVTK